MRLVATIEHQCALVRIVQPAAITQAISARPSEAQLLLLRLDLVALRPRSRPVLGLNLRPLLAQTPIDRVLRRVAASGGLVHESLGVTLLECCDNVLARCVGQVSRRETRPEVPLLGADLVRFLCADEDAYLRLKDPIDRARCEMRREM